MKVLFLTHFGENVIKDIQHLPRAGETVYLFGRTHTVSNIAWFPDENYLFAKTIPKDVEVIVTL